MSRTHHRHIPRLYEIVREPSSQGKVAVVMEWAGKGELFHIVQRAGRLDSRTAFNYFVQLLSAVEYLHTIGIVHRDIKLVCDSFAALSKPRLGKHLGARGWEAAAFRLWICNPLSTGGSAAHGLRVSELCCP